MIFNNLVSNAVKYNRDNGEVFISVSQIADGVSIAVRDTGIGMSPDEVSKLFGEFVRIRNKKTADILGSGLLLWGGCSTPHFFVQPGKIVDDLLKGVACGYCTFAYRTDLPAADIVRAVRTIPAAGDEVVVVHGDRPAGGDAHASESVRPG